MRLTLRQLQIFIAIASSGSTTTAANKVALSQSATSSALNDLENLLGAPLFDRVGKRLLLNDNGRMLLPQARQIVTLASAAEAQFSDGGAGGRDLLIGASTTIGTYMLPNLIAAYRARYGEVVPRVTIANTAEVAQAVANYDVEIGFIEGPCHINGLRIEPWIQDELIVVAAPGHALAGTLGKAGAAELADAKWLLRETGSGTREAVENALLPHLQQLNEGGQFSSSEAIKHACAAGLGLACLSRSVVADLIALGRLREVRTTLPPLKRTLYMIHGGEKTLSVTLGQFHDFCREWRPGRGRVARSLSRER